MRTKNLSKKNTISRYCTLKSYYERQRTISILGEFIISWNMYFSQECTWWLENTSGFCESQDWMAVHCSAIWVSENAWLDAGEQAHKEARAVWEEQNEGEACSPGKMGIVNSNLKGRSQEFFAFVFFPSNSYFGPNRDVLKLE